MIRRLMAASVLLIVGGIFLGCENQGTTTVMDPRLQEENRNLKQRVFDLESEKEGLQQELVGARQETATARLDSEKWRTKYDAALEAVPTSASTGLPPELVRMFIDIAQAGGPFELGPTGSLKASSDILFDSGKATLKPTGAAAIKAIAPKLKEILTDKRVMLRVDGHTDADPIVRSGWDDNLQLSLERARAVVKILAAEGIPSETMFAAGFGQWHPVAPNDSAANKGKNRRVELTLVAVAPTLAPSSAPEAAPPPPPVMPMPPE